jgi:hypothetical protein
MKAAKEIFRAAVAAVLAMLLSAPAMAQGPQQNTSSSSAAVAEDALPDSPQPAQQSQPTAAPQSLQPPVPQQDQKSPKPVGTAAAPYEKTMGVAASRPAGAAIAPAKQRRVRTILISLGVILGAGVAVGSVAALSHGSPSRP